MPGLGSTTEPRARTSRQSYASLEEEVRALLRSVVNEADVPAGGLGTEIAALFAGTGIDFEIPELRGHQIKPASFDE